MYPPHEGAKLCDLAAWGLVNMRGVKRRLAWGRSLLLLAAVPTVVVLAGYLAPGVNFLDRLERSTQDWRFRLRPPLAPDPRLLLVEVNDESLQRLGPWPWPRERWAALVDRLASAGVRAIVCDVFFPERTAPAADRALAEATRRAGCVYHATFAASSQGAERVWDPSRVAPGALTLRVVPGVGLNSGAELGGFSPLLGSYPELSAAAAGLGFVEVVDAGDGVFRYVYPVARVGERVYPSLALRAALDLLGATPQDGTVYLGRRLEFGALRLPLDRGGRLVINYLGPAGTFPRVSAVQVLSGEIAPDRLRDKIAVLGATAVGLHDLRPAPFGAAFDGVETQTTLLDNLLTGRLLREAPPEQGVLLVLAGALLVALLFALLPTAGASVGSTLLLGLYSYLCLWAFDSRDLLLPWVAPGVTMVLTVMVCLGYHAVGHEREVRRARRQLSRYLPPRVVAQMEHSSEEVPAGLRQPVTVLFSDLRDFTATSSRLGAEAVVALLNRYFGLMYETLTEFGGTLDKYLGDGLMAYFISPPGDHEHAALAVQAAVEMQRGIRANRDEWTFSGMPELRAGIGIATGEVVLGNIGTPQRMQYTVIGPEVNLAARLSELSKTLETEILIDESTYRLARDYIVARPLGRVEIRGYPEPQAVYAVVGEDRRPSPLGDDEASEQENAAR